MSCTNGSVSMRIATSDTILKMVEHSFVITTCEGGSCNHASQIIVIPDYMTWPKYGCAMPLYPSKARKLRDEMIRCDFLNQGSEIQCCPSDVVHLFVPHITILFRRSVH